jgi:hypothetical protein
MFRAAEVLIVSKMDLAPHLRFDVERALENARKVNPALNIFQVSAYTGEGLDEWYGWINNRLGTRAENRLCALQPCSRSGWFSACSTRWRQTTWLPWRRWSHANPASPTRCARAWPGGLDIP